MDLNDLRSVSSIQMESMKATMNALRSQLDHEKNMLKNDIVQTLKCQSVLGSGSADLLYTSGLLARLKSLEDNRESPRERDLLREPLPPDHAGATPPYCLEGRADDEVRTFGGSGEVYRTVYSSGGSSNCVRHCCSLKSAQALKSTSGAQMRTFSKQSSIPSVSMHNPSLPKVDEVPGMSERNVIKPNTSWSGDADVVRPASKGYPSPKPEYPFPEPQPHYNPAYCRPAEYVKYAYPPSCTCVPFRVPSYIQRAQDILPDPCNRHCLTCCTWQLPEKQRAVVKEEKCLCMMSSHCRHYSPEASPRHHSHHHEKAPRYNRHHQTTKEVERGTAKSTGDDALVADIDESREQEAEIEYAIIDSAATEIDEEEPNQVEDTDHPPSSKIHVTPRSSSSGSAQSRKAGEILVEEPTRDMPVQYHYTNELSSQLSGGSSLFESEATFDQVVHQPTCAQKRTKLGSSKPRRRGKRTNRDQGITKSAGGVNLPSSTERTRSMTHPPRLADYDPTIKATCATTTPDLTRAGRPKDRSSRNSSNKNRWSGSELLLLPPAMHHTIPSNPRKKTLRNDPLKPLETYYASLTGTPKSKRSERGDVGKRSEGSREAKTQIPELSRKTSRTTRLPNPFSLIFDELRSSPMMRGVPPGRKIF